MAEKHICNLPLHFDYIKNYPGIGNGCRCFG